MPKLVELEDGRVIEFPDGMSDTQIDANLRLSLAGEQGMAQATAGAVERSKPAEANERGADMFRSQLSRAGTFGAAPTQEDIQEGREQNIPMLTLGAMAAPATIGGAIAAPAATAKGLLGSLVGGAVGNEAGQWVGRRVPVVGGEMLGDVLGGIGGLVGGVGGGMTAPKLGAKELFAMLPGGGKGGMLAQILGRGEAEVAKGAATQAAKTVAPEVAEEVAKKAAGRELDIAIKQAKLKQIADDAAAKAAKEAAKEARAQELHQIRVEAARAKAAGKPGPRAVPKSGPATAPRTEGATALKPEPEFIPDEAVSLVAEPLPFRPRGSTKPATNLGGKARPGPAPTPPDKLEETLRASLDAIAEKKASKGALQAIAEKVETSPLQVPRIQIGAQRVGRQVGLTKEEVRQQAGPVLDEALGEASPILPIEPFRKIIDTMKAIPPAEREAYVARATSGKAKAQIENIRRTLEHLGLLLPVGAAVGAASSE